MYWNTLGRSGRSIFDLDVSLGRAILTPTFEKGLDQELKLIRALL